MQCQFAMRLQFGQSWLTVVAYYALLQFSTVIRAVTGQFWDPTKVSFKSKYIGGIPENYQDVEIAYSRDPGIQISYPVDWLFNNLDLNINVAEGRTSEISPAVTVVTALRSVLKSKLHLDDLSPAAVAALLGLESEPLLKALKRNGTTLSKEIKHMKIEQAKDALSNSEKTISEIGASLGYSDSAHFTRFFRSQTGINPSLYRSRADLQNR